MKKFCDLTTNWHEQKIVNCFIKRFFWLAPLSILMQVIYTGQIQPANAYAFMHEIEWDLPGIALWIIWLVVTASIFPGKLNKPSDFLLLTYGLFVLLCGASLWGASGQLELYGGILLLGFLSVSLIVYQMVVSVLTTSLNKYSPFFHVLTVRSYFVPLCIVMLIAVVIGVTSGQQGGFSLESSYFRRMSGRESFPVGALSSYIFSMVLNGVAPFLAFSSALRKKYLQLPIPLLFSIYVYWLLGTKAPIVMVFLMAGIGYIYARGRGENISRYLLFVVMGLLLTSLVELAIWDYSYLSDYFIRRAFAVVAQLQGAYVGYGLENFELTEWVIGIEGLGDKPVSFLIGEQYFGNAQTNANSNALIYSLLKNGMVGWISAIAFVSLVFSVMNYLYIKRKNEEVMGLGFLYALLLTEQAYSTAFLSSGIGLVIVLLIALSKQQRLSRGHR